MRKEVGLAYRTSLPRRPLFAGAKTPRSSYTFPTGILARDPGRAVGRSTQSHPFYAFFV